MEQHEVKKTNPVVGYVRDSVQEIRKVTWPTRHQATNMTILVIIISIAAAAIIAGLDYVFTLGYQKVLELLGPTGIPISDTLPPTESSTTTTVPVTLPVTPDASDVPVTPD